MNLTIPTRNDPIARFAVFALMALALYASFAPARPDVQAQDIIIMATPTPALPTPALNLDPAIVFSLPTPVWIPADSPTVTSQEAPGATEAGAVEYLAVVGAQAEHSPRGDVVHPPSYATGVVLDPGPSIIIDPLPIAEVGIAVAVPPISAEQAAILAQRESNGCAAGETFYPRTGCHRMGSGGPMPGAVGER